MKSEIESGDINAIRPILSSLLKNMAVVGFEYYAGFSVRLEREVRQDSLLPFQLDLELKGDWRIGDPQEWELELSRFPQRPVSVDQDEPYRAYRLMSLVGDHVIDVMLAPDGSLTLATPRHENLYIAGIESIDEDSWVIRVPSDLPEYDKWLFICDSEGHVFARWEAVKE